MRVTSVEPSDITVESAVGSVLCNDLLLPAPEGRRRLHKGTKVGPDDVDVLRSSGRPIHLLRLEPGEVHEDEAGARIARACAGPGVDIGPPVESQSRMRAAHRGLLCIAAADLTQVNQVPDVSVYTLFDGQPVDRDMLIAAAKVTPLCVPDDIVRRVEEIAAATGPIISVAPFLGRPVGVLARADVLAGARPRFEAAIEGKMRWFGSSVWGVRYPPDDAGAIAGAIEDLVRADVGLIIAAGVNSTDPLDPTLQALELLRAEVERRGVPVHPGSTCWLAYLEAIPVFGLALCGVYSGTTALDLLLPRFMAGRRPSAQDIAALGAGGLLSKGQAFRFPPYQ